MFIHPDVQSKHMVNNTGHWLASRKVKFIPPSWQRPEVGDLCIGIKEN